MRNENKQKRILVVGGGAAGYFGAIRAREIFSDIPVVLVEATPLPLKKVRISGGGRCNLTHHCFDPAELVKNYPRGSRELRGVFARFQPEDTLAWFASRGVPTKAEADGRMFPISDDSTSIVDCLESAARKSGVEVRLGCRLKSLRFDPNEKIFAAEFQNGEPEAFSACLLASGSAPTGYELAKALGHSITPLAPSLFTFNIIDDRLRELSGISFPSVALELIPPGKKSFLQSGPLLITHWGLSGPAVLKLSAWAARELLESNYQADLIINFLPGENQESAREILERAKAEYPKRQLATQNPFALPNRFWANLLEFLQIRDIEPWINLSKKNAAAICEALIRGKFRVLGKGVFKEEFVTCGGIALNEVDFRTMESKRTPGLYFAGEILDIDGITGGFNFQNAWSTAWIAGENIGKSLEP